jgi:hypothetical protein
MVQQNGAMVVDGAAAQLRKVLDEAAAMELLAWTVHRSTHYGMIEQRRLQSRNSGA